jgi:LysM repeat protein
MIHAAALLTAVEHREAAAKPPAHHVTVRSGDTLSAIAGRYHIQWPGLYEANKAKIGADPDVLRIGEHLKVPSAAAAVRLAARYTPPPAPVAAPAPATTAAPAASTTYQQPAAPAPAATASASYSAPSGSFQQCVINSESGGNSQVMNSSGHYGLYQFSYSTWVANGGSPGSFGSASVAQQNQVFSQTVASSGTSAWAPYDGC